MAPDASPTASPTANLAGDMGTGVSPVQFTSRRDAVVNEIRRSIVVGGLRPGERLTEGKLAASLSVSRPTMREALATLAQEGLLVQEPYRGLRVASLSAVEIMDIARTRVALDMQAARDVLDDPSGRRLSLVADAWTDYDRLAIDADPVAAHEAHVTFHRRIWEASENTFLLRLWPAVQANITIALAQDQAARNDPRRTHDVHQRVVEAIASEDLDRVHSALEAHTIDNARELAAMVERTRSSAG